MFEITRDELEKIRVGLKKKNVPEVFDGAWCSEPGIGGMKAEDSEQGLIIQWVSFDEKGEKSALKKARMYDLCCDETCEASRYELGMVVATILRTQGNKSESSTGHPIEAAKVAKQAYQAANIWEHWAKVPAGFMYGSGFYER